MQTSAGKFEKNVAAVVTRQIITLLAISILAGGLLTRLLLDNKSFARIDQRHRLLSRRTAVDALPRLTVAQLVQLKSTSLNLNILDARDSVSFEAGHIPGAVNVFATTDWRAIRIIHPQLDLKRSTIVYCSDQTCRLDQTLAASLMDAGFEDVRLLTGGYGAWSGRVVPVD